MRLQGSMVKLLAVSPGACDTSKQPALCGATPGARAEHMLYHSSRTSLHIIVKPELMPRQAFGL